MAVHWSVLYLVLSLYVVMYVSCSKQPNIVIIVADDLGWDDVSFHGSNQIPTPNIDKLAHSGVILNNYYVSPICTPTRSALLTGRHPIHTGLQHSVITSGQPYGLNLNETTLAEYLKPLGYSSHMVGKWHLGFFSKEHTPTHRGFDTHYGYYQGMGDYYDHSYQCWHLGFYMKEATPTYRGFQSYYGYYNGKKDYYDHTDDSNGWWGYDFRDSMNIVPRNETFGLYSTELFTKRAVKVIETHDTSTPLFLYLAHQAVHSANPEDPLQAPPEAVYQFTNIWNPHRRNFAGMVSKLDESVGQVTAALEKSGLMDNTIILFTTDNGGPANGFDMNYASNWPLRGVKATHWEGGVRGTGFIYSKLLEKSGYVNTEMLHVCDFVPTLYDLAGGNSSQLKYLDGMNVWSTLSAGKTSPRTEILHNIDPLEGRSAIRVGRYKLIVGSNAAWAGWYHPSGSLPDERSPSPLKNSAAVECAPPPDKFTGCPTYCLFDIQTDPCEYTDIADQYPETVEYMLKRLAYYNSTMVPPLHPPVDPNANPKLFDYTWSPWLNLTDQLPHFVKIP